MQRNMDANDEIAAGVETPWHPLRLVLILLIALFSLSGSFLFDIICSTLGCVRCPLINLKRRSLNKVHLSKMS